MLYSVFVMGGAGGGAGAGARRSLYMTRENIKGV